jgi:hypothetical protein
MGPCDLGHAARGRAKNEFVSLPEHRFPNPADRLDEPLRGNGGWLLSGDVPMLNRQGNEQTHRRHTRQATLLHCTRLRHTHLAIERKYRRNGG